MIHRRHAFTVIELLVVVSIIALLIGILMPALGKARDTAQVTVSQNNLRNLVVSHGSYINEWNDHQFSLIHDNISAYGNNGNEAFIAFGQATGSEHTPIYVGWGPNAAGNGNFHWRLVSSGSDSYEPISFTGQSGSGGERFGAFRLLNVEAFHHYVSGRFYEPTFYAPKDRIVMESIQVGLESPHSFHYQGYGNLQWSSYCFSPAAMYHPSVMRRPSAGGWQNPWDIDGGFRSPSPAAALYPALKTQLAEHHWLQNRSGPECHPSFVPGTYEGCEPYYFNASWVSQPMMAFWDGHVEGIGIRDAMRADGRMMAQSDGDGLWSHDTFWGDDGYFSEFAYDQATTSLHILTTDGIRGRDMIAD
ncbi:MAG: type II secretion system protein [Planctomycetota bacterium]|jgi:prepilin-type N-terminal cleavage/methylation domain-containing protein/prepilin-type processing-associated H-X9-DG protein